jgi:acyl-CoA synthetase (NDP forming)
MSVVSVPERRAARFAAVPDLDAARQVLAGARGAGRARLLEPEGIALLHAIGISTPGTVFVPPGETGSPIDLSSLRSDRIVVKVVSTSIVHKTELGGVAFVDREERTIRAAIRQMSERMASQRIAGFLIAELVEHDASIGGELLVSVRWTSDFGAIVSIGAGGIHAETLARDLKAGRGLAIVAAGVTPLARLPAVLAEATAVRLATAPQRGRPPLGSITELVDLVSKLESFAVACVPGEVAEMEMNPVAVTPSGLIALDVVVSLSEAEGRPVLEQPPRPVRKLSALLEPRSIAIAGVSRGENPGRTILRNVLRDGFDAEAITVLKPRIDRIDGCRCVPTVAELPGKVDLLVVALNARASAELVADAIERDAAESIIVIPGGLEEKAGGDALASRMRSALHAARRRPDGGPVINGGNCLGIRSRPGRYDTLFIPEARLAGPSGHPAPLAIVAQSGAFAITRLSRLVGLDPKYVITVGNQMDLTVGDHLAHLASDPEVRVVGAYVEGFAPLDGREFMAAARVMRARGGIVVLYRAGRTTAGASASASHTAAIAGDALVTSALARQAGIVVADTLETFDDFVRTFTLMAGRTAGGPRLGALSNAGFECVAIGDNLGPLELATFEPRTADRLGDVLREVGIGDIVDVHDPLDLTPMTGDAAFAAAAEAILDDDGVDVAVIGNVPFTQALRTVPEDVPDGALDAPAAVAGRLIDLWRRTTKPWVAVVDGGPRYDPLARALEAGGIPTFRTADAALHALRVFVAARRA